MPKKKYTVKELMEMDPKKVEELCGPTVCNEKKCLFPKRYFCLREDGYCLAQCIRKAKGWIDYDEGAIVMEKRECAYNIRKIKARIKRYKQLLRYYEKDKNL